MLADLALQRKKNYKGHFVGVAEAPFANSEVLQ